MKIDAVIFEVDLTSLATIDGIIIYYLIFKNKTWKDKSKTLLRFSNYKGTKLKYLRKKLLIVINYLITDPVIMRC